MHTMQCSSNAGNCGSCAGMFLLHRHFGEPPLFAKRYSICLNTPQFLPHNALLLPPCVQETPKPFDKNDQRNLFHFLVCLCWSCNVHTVSCLAKIDVFSCVFVMVCPGLVVQWHARCAHADLALA